MTTETETYVFDIDGEPLRVKVPAGFASQEMLLGIVKQEKIKRATKDVGPLQAAGLGAVETARKAVTTIADPIQRMLGQEPDMEQRGRRKEAMGALREARPISTAVGGAAPYMAMPFSTVPRAAASGAASGFIESEGDPTAAAMGAGLGAGMTGLTQRLIRPVRPSPQAQGLMQEGVQPTVGQAVKERGSIGHMAAMTEEKLQSVPFIGDAISHARRRAVGELRTAAIRRAVPAGKEMPKGTVREVLDQLGGMYDEGYRAVYGGASFPLRPNNYKSIQRVIDDKQYMLTGDAREQVKGFLTSLMAPGIKDGAYSGEALQRAISTLRARSREGLKSGDAVTRDMGRMYGSLGRALGRWRDQNLPPSQVQKIHSLDGKYAHYKRIEDASTRAGAEVGDFTPAQLAAAVQRTDRKSKYAKGRALMQDLSDPGKLVLQSKFPESGTTPRMLMGGGGLAGAYALDPAIAASYGGATGAAWLGQTRPIQKYMLGGFPIQQSPMLQAAPSLAGKLSPLLLGE